MILSQEFQNKLERLRIVMKELQLDGIYLKRQDSFAWLTCGGRNYVGAGDMGNCGLLVTQDGYHAITNTIEAPRMISEEHLGELGFSMYQSIWYDGAFEQSTLRQLVPSMKIGYDYGTLDNISEHVKQLRMNLTEGEVDRYLKLGVDASLAMESVATRIRPGMTEFEVAGAVMNEMEVQGLELISCMVAADDRISSYRHPLPTSRQIQKRVQLGGNFRRGGLIVCMTRYCNFVPVSAELRRQYRDNQKIDCVYMINSKPGFSYQKPLLAGQQAYTALGYEGEFEKHHQGGPIGYAGRDYRVDFSTPGVIKACQAFCWNPSITGTKSEDTMITSEKGIQMVSHPVLFPKVTIQVEGIEFVRPDILEI